MRPQFLLIGLIIINVAGCKELNVVVKALPPVESQEPTIEPTGTIVTTTEPIATPEPTSQPQEIIPEPTPEPRLTYLYGTWININTFSDEEDATNQFVFDENLSGSQTSCEWTFNWHVVTPIVSSQQQFDIDLTQLRMGLTMSGTPCSPRNNVWYQERGCNVLIFDEDHAQINCLYGGESLYKRITDHQYRRIGDYQWERIN